MDRNGFVEEEKMKAQFRAVGIPVRNPTQYEDEVLGIDAWVGRGKTPKGEIIWMELQRKSSPKGARDHILARKKRKFIPCIVGIIPDDRGSVIQAWADVCNVGFWINPAILKEDPGLADELEADRKAALRGE